mgnify:FL=1
MAFTAVVSALGLGYQVYSGEQQRKQQERQLAMQRQANIDAKKEAKQAQDRADMEYNKANRQTTDVGAITDESKLMGKSGIGGTMLTGNMGIDPNQLNLGKKTLLGS